MDRRRFIKLSAISGTAATLASCGSPEHELVRFIPDEDLVPGVAEYKASVCPLCHAGCGTTVKVMDGDVDVVRSGQAGVVRMGLAKKIDGNPIHPVSQGRLCVRGQAGLQVTYHPDRITRPLKRSGARGTGQFQPIGWDVAIAGLLSQLDGLASAGGERALAFLGRPGTGSRQQLIAEFLERFGAPPPITFELFSDDVLRRANLLSFGHEQLPTYDLEHARYVLSFGADILGTWNSPVAQTIGYGRMRQEHPGERGKFVQVEPRMSLTGASADEWIPLTPGSESVLALGLAHVILRDQLRDQSAAGRAGALIDGWSAGLTDYAPQTVARRTGVSETRIERLARELATAWPALTLVGGAALAHTNGLFTALAVNALEALLGSVGAPGGLSFMPQVAAAPARVRPARPTTLNALASGILAADRSPVQVLFLDDVNPVFATPAAWKVREALLKVPFIVSFHSFLDDTSVLADLVLPDHSFLESWIDARPESGAAVAVANVAPPVMRPLHQTRAMTDVLLDTSRRLKRPITPPLPWQTFDEMVRASFVSVAQGDVDEAWETAQKQGGVWDGLKVRSLKPEASAANAKVDAHKAADAQFDGDAAMYPFYFLPYASQALLDGSLAHLPWLQELPDPMTSAMWSNWVEINPQTAARLSIASGDILEIGSQHGTVRAPAVLSPGIAPDVIGMPVGQGHETFTRYASGVGSNPIKILAPTLEPETSTLAWAATRVRVTRIATADGTLVQLAGADREQPHGIAR